MDFDKHRKSKKLDIQNVKKYLKNRGFTDIDLNQQWRHLSGTVTKNNKDQFFKLASTEGVAERTKNEFAWNNLISNNPKINLPLSVPMNYESGEYQDLFWFTCELVKGKPLAKSGQPGEIKNLKNNLGKIAKTAKNIVELKTKQILPNDKRSRERTESTPKERFLKLLEHWMSQFEKDVTDLYDFIETNIEYWKTAPCHGDFVPWHILKTQENNFYLIDGEHSKIEGFKFYDVAYFYHRAYTKLKRPDIADKFLDEFNKLYSFDKENKECFRVILSQRLIGGYMDAKNDGVTSVELQDELVNKLLKDKLTLN